jgi:hypothetical protein
MCGNLRGTTAENQANRTEALDREGRKRMKRRLINDGLVLLTAGGTINKLTFKLGPEQLTAADRKVMGEALARAHD